jgi:hypothetical protein
VARRSGGGVSAGGGGGGGGGGCGLWDQPVVLPSAKGSGSARHGDGGPKQVAIMPPTDYIEFKVAVADQVLPTSTPSPCPAPEAYLSAAATRKANVSELRHELRSPSLDDGRSAHVCLGAHVCLCPHVV